MSEQSQTGPSPEELQNTQEELLNKKRSLIENISTQLGFVESLGMKEIRAQIIDESGKISTEILNVWRDQAEVFIEAIGNKDVFLKAQIGLLVTKALVYLDANMPNEFYEYIDDAIMYASELGLDDIVEELRRL